MGQDWVAWHAQYDDPGHPLVARLAATRRAIGSALDAAGPGAKVLSVCAGDGRDLLPQLVGRQVRGRLVELDPDLAAVARAAAPPGVEVVTGDAGRLSAYEGFAPANVVVFCGILGNISDADVETSIGLLPRLCGPGAHVIWTRHRRPPDLTPAIRTWFSDAGFHEVSFETPTDGHSWSVGSHRYDGVPRTMTAHRMFHFL